MANISKIKLPDGTSYDIKDSNAGTVTSVTIKATSPIEVNSSSAITSSGTRTISHATSGATAGSYGDSSAQTPSYGETFKVPYVTVNATGHVTGISEHTVKIPASDNTNTHRPIQVNGTQILGDNTTALNLKAGSNVSLSNSSGTVTIAATDTTYESKSAASGGTAVSLVTTGEKYTWNNKQATLVSGTNIKTINGSSILGSGNLSVSNPIITDVLLAGSTSITINDERITEDSILSFYTSIYGVIPSSQPVVTNGSITLTFSAQSTSMVVGVCIEGTYSS